MKLQDPRVIQRWIVPALFMYLVLCVVGFLLVFTADTSSQFIGSLSAKEFLLVFFALSPLIALAYGFLEWFLEFTIRAVGQAFSRFFMAIGGKR